MDRFQNPYRSFLPFKYILLPLCLVLVTCTEPIAFEIEDFEDVLVIDANITDEEKQQEIFISRTFLFGENVRQETGATVTVTDDMGNAFAFLESEPGRYTSTTEFRAEMDRNYSLSIEIANGDSYISGPIQLAADAELEEVIARPLVDESGQEGIAIFASGFDPQGEANFYRYDYEETIKVESFYANNFELAVVSENPPTLQVAEKTRKEDVCYRTQTSNSILIASTEDLAESRVQDFQVRFIPEDNYEIRSRYSIQVNQHVQSATAHEFYETLREFSNVQSLFSQTQPGFIQGNITSVGTNNSRVLGLFEVSSVAKKRIFVEHDDFFPDRPTPDYFSNDCMRRGFGISDPTLFRRIQSGSHRYVGEEGPLFFIAPVICVDCTLIGSITVPDFWEE